MRVRAEVGDAGGSRERPPEAAVVAAVLVGEAQAAVAGNVLKKDLGNIASYSDTVRSTSRLLINKSTYNFTHEKV